MAAIIMLSYMYPVVVSSPDVHTLPGERTSGDFCQLPWQTLPILCHIMHNDRMTNHLILFQCFSIIPIAAKAALLDMLTTAGTTYFVAEIQVPPSL